MQNADGGSEPELSRYLGVLKRRWAWFAVPLIAISAAAVTYSNDQPLEYGATARVLLADTEAQRALDPGSQNASYLNRELSNEISLAKSDRAVGAIEAEFGEDSDIDISADASADILVFDATAATPERAAGLANAWAETYVAIKQEQAASSLDQAMESLEEKLKSLQRDRDTLRSPLVLLDTQISNTELQEDALRLQLEYDRMSNQLAYELELIDAQATVAAASVANLELRAELSAIGTARLVQVAAEPEEPSNLPLSNSLILGLVVGTLVGIGSALLRESLDRSLRTEHDIQRAVSIPVLALVARPSRKERKSDPALALRNDPYGRTADAFQKVRSALQFAGVDHELTSVLVTSANQSEAKTTTSSNLAWALASVGRRTVLADVDFRRPRVHSVYGLPAEPGLADHVIHGKPFAELVEPVKNDTDSMLVLPVGTLPPNPAGFVGSDAFLYALDWLEQESDAVVLDAPPVLPVSDALTMSTHADAVVLTVMARKTKKAELEAAVEALQRVGANILGIVLLGVRRKSGYGRYSAQYTPGPARGMLGIGGKS